MDLNTCADYLRQHDQYMLITHRRPDGDTLGSAAALCHALRRAGKTAFLYPNPEITDTYMPFIKPYLADASYTGETFVSVDVADEPLFCRGFTGKVDLWLDHHPGRNGLERFGMVWPQKASCGELVMEIIESLCGDICPEEANLLYMAVSTDTGCFVYANTNAETHRAAARLADAGAQFHPINNLLFRTRSRARLMLEGMIFSSLRSYRNDSINVAVITLDMMRRSGATEDDCDDLANLAGLVRGNRVSITVRELRTDPPQSKVSVRTDGCVDASRVCALFGGGGHKMAAGCEMDKTPEETAEAMRLAVEEAWA